MLIKVPVIVVRSGSSGGSYRPPESAALINTEHIVSVVAAQVPTYEKACHVLLATGHELTLSCDVADIQRKIELCGIKEDPK